MTDQSTAKSQLDQLYAQGILPEAAYRAALAALDGPATITVAGDRGLPSNRPPISNSRPVTTHV